MVIFKINNKLVFAFFLFIIALRSCHEYNKAGLTWSGWYMVDPDGQGNGEAAFPVQCDMETGATLVHHDSEDPIRIPLCTDEDCFVHLIEYPTSTRQLRNLIELSGTCSQSIQVRLFEFDIN